MKLYYSPGTCSFAAHIIAHELDLDLDLEKVDLKSKITAGGADYSAINPKGYVPALEIDQGILLTEGPAVLQYLAAQRPERNLLPAEGRIERYRVLEWLGFINSELHKSFTPLWHAESASATKDTAREILARRFRYLDHHLSTHRYLLGNAFTLPDAYCFTVVNWSNYLALDLAPYPNLQRYMNEIETRPAVEAAMAAEGLKKAA
ncbi:glutathione transferase GstA [Dongia soli]|uniref:Glutathione transferase GstA n=1 Tax=Dongia soli TaxID=600628 RepID=A0ABU5E6U8_9PROT|nr:glutathione transferase GstA [Dongia soli]MDY0881439.1 glutathione transferase GstA [Dongia soli]